MITTYTLYKAYSSAGEPLYVGATTNIGQRLHDHRHGKSWWGEVETIKLEHFDNIDDLLEAEQSGIFVEKPRYNQVHLKPHVWAMKPRRPKGQRGVYQRSDGLWVGSVEIAPGKNGQRRQKRVASKSREVAEQKLAALMRELEEQRA